MSPKHAMEPMHVYAVRRRKDYRSVDLISDVLPFGRLGKASQTRSATQLTTRNSKAGHIAPSFGFSMNLLI